MRYYDLKITNPTSGAVWQPSTKSLGLIQAQGGSTFTSFVNGQTLPGALNVEFDIPVYPFAQPQGNAILRVWGVGLPMIGQAAQLAFQNFSLSAGMQKGLPLANPAQAGVIAQGQIFQSFGNWQGVNQTLDMILYPGCAASGQDIHFSWTKNTPLGSAISSTLSAAFPSYTVKVNVSNNLLSDTTQAGHYTTLAEFADHVLQISQQIGQPIFNTKSYTYPGVNISVNGNTLYVSDGQGAAAEKLVELAFQDLIGQPTWIDPLTVTFKTTLRADIAVGNLVKFPLGVQAPYALTSAAAAAPNAPASSKTAFQGTFSVIEAHHYANFRQPDAESWNTTYSAVAVPKSNA